MIEVRGLIKSFDERKVLDDISVSFEKGKTNLIIGSSGSGKTTIAKCVVGLMEPDSGEVLFDGRDFIKMNFRQRKELRKEIGFLFQGSALFDSHNVEENVMFPLMMYTDMSKKDMIERTNFCLNRVNLREVNYLYPSELSGGMRKRVGIARAIAMNPSYLLCDEPNSGLDPQTAILIDALIKEITEEYNITTIVITHDMNSVFEIGEKVVFIHKGKKWWEGSKHDILDTKGEELLEFIYASALMKKIKKLK